MSFQILNVKIDNLAKEEIVEKIKNCLKSNSHCQIATVNPEFILRAQENKKFKNILNSKKTLCVADGIGLKFAGWWYGQNLKYRWAGADLMKEILKIADEKKQKVFLIANKDGLSTWQETAMAIKKLYPKLKISGINISIKSTPYKIPDTKHDVIFCSLGAPQQEIFLYQLRSVAKIVMGVGGSFDFLTGKIKRAPGFFRQFGLEWLWRLMVEPKYRWKRIWRAVIIFPIKVVFKK